MSNATMLQQHKKTTVADSQQLSAPLQAKNQSDAKRSSPHQLVDHRPQTQQLLALQRQIVDSPRASQLKTMQRMSQASAAAAQLNADASSFNHAVLAGAGESATVQAKAEQSSVASRSSEAAAAQANQTGLPDNLKAGIESLSGMSMDHVNVHYNSPEPAQLNAHAYAQGSDIHVAPGQEKHLPHEAWHVVQQAQGRVRPTMQMKTGVAVNDDAGLEAEADQMGAKAMQMQSTNKLLSAQIKDHARAGASQLQARSNNSEVVQLLAPTGNFATYDAATLAVNGQNGGANPTDAIVRNSGTQGPASNPPDPGGWADMIQNEEDMRDPFGAVPLIERTSFKINVRIDGANGHNYTKMHAVNSWLGLGTNHANNIFSGRQSFNLSHNDRIEGTANGFLDHQSWIATAGTNLNNSLNAVDQIGRNGAGQAYYKAGATNAFPVAFYNAGVNVVGNDGNNYPSLNEDVMDLKGYLIEYRVRPTYALVHGTVANSIVNYGMNRYNNNRPNAAHGGETFDIAPGSAIHTAVAALCDTYATSLRIELTTYAPNPADIGNGVDVASDALPWTTYNTAPVVMHAPEPAAEMALNYRNNSNKRTGLRWYGPFVI